MPTHRERIENQYDADIVTLIEQFYADGLSQHEMAEKLDLPRSSLRYYIRESSIDPPDRTLSDIQRIVTMALLPHLGNGAIARRVGCNPRTVRRYRKEVAETGEPVDLSGDFSTEERELLQDIVTDWLRRKHGNDFDFDELEQGAHNNA